MRFRARIAAYLDAAGLRQELPRDRRVDFFGLRDGEDESASAEDVLLDFLTAFCNTNGQFNHDYIPLRVAIALVARGEVGAGQAKFLAGLQEAKDLNGDWSAMAEVIAEALRK